ncbi:DUF2283 domain-containing protein [Patescibacteria group bacterium]|nr:DUF2283 domain-containing protein [Patescibacteria group bacterium]MBU0879792.1 DUF2283 domain-containing protein [Patescibacteria group bacterium]MBU0880148.1 DUF2283 domain-containing protein [Patescibacteria group bacterium]MBU0898022.1 DUF2283 domain-containing protein [Patescibacteria group bacterium]MBU1062936.1 DUF2283 domain-containing protein [Patescibacteria group bacterium]
MNYDIESNLISLELAKDPINHTIEFGDFIIHLSKTKKPILIEILNASKFIGKMDKLKRLESFKKPLVEIS